MKFRNDRPKIMLLLDVVLCFPLVHYLHQVHSHLTIAINQMGNVPQDKFELIINSIQEFSFAPYSAKINVFLTNIPKTFAALCVQGAATAVQPDPRDYILKPFYSRKNRPDLLRTRTLYCLEYR
ncbi:MAG: hypothetical protein COA36_03050 [Desulfotalea sp.]|nr:MAG: hypothetical protein COA36_03050 [Desulfotalea sp.]